MRFRIAVIAAAFMAMPASEAGAQDGLQEFPQPLLEELRFEQKSPQRLATQATMLRFIQKGRLRGAYYHLRRLLSMVAHARYQQRPDLESKLRSRILQQRATIRTISSTM
jgi:hypothetical protein